MVEGFGRKKKSLLGTIMLIIVIVETLITMNQPAKPPHTQTAAQPSAPLTHGLGSHPQRRGGREAPSVLGRMLCSSPQRTPFSG